MGRKGIHFLKTVSKSEAERIWHDALRLGPLGTQEVTLPEAQDRVLLVGTDVGEWQRLFCRGTD